MTVLCSLYKCRESLQLFFGPVLPHISTRNASTTFKIHEVKWFGGDNQKGSCSQVGKGVTGKKKKGKVWISLPPSKGLWLWGYSTYQC